MKDAALRTFRWKFGQVDFDESSWELRINGEVQALEPRPLKVLCLLLRRAGRVVSKSELHAAVWPRSVPGDKALTNAVNKLRNAIGDKDQSVIETVHKIGYRFSATVKRKVIRQSPLLNPYSDDCRGEVK